MSPNMHGLAINKRPPIGSSASGVPETNPYAFVGEYCFQEPDYMPTPVSNRVLVGSVRHATAVPMLRRLGVTHVCNCAAGDCGAPADEYEEHGIEYLAFPAADAEGYPILQRHMKAVLDFVAPFMENQSTLAKGTIKPNAGKVLMHCSAGRNRSVTLALALELVHGAEPLPNLVRRLFQRRPFILTNQSFRQQLATLAEQRGLLVSPSPLVDGRVIDGGHKALTTFACKHCGQPHCVSDEGRLDFALSVDCGAFTVGQLVELIQDKFGCPSPNLEFETLAELDKRKTAVSCRRRADLTRARCARTTPGVRPVLRAPH